MTQQKESPDSHLGRAHRRILGIIAGGGAPSTTKIQRGATELAEEPEARPPHASEAETQPAQPPAKMHWLTVAVVVGALSGAFMAVVTYYTLAQLSPMQDPRVAAIATRIVEFEQTVEQQGRVLRSTDVDVARLIDRNTSMSQRVDSEAARTDQAFAAIGETRGRLNEVLGTGSPVFGIAIAQLGQALAEGRRFETEWVNLFSLTADDPQLRLVLASLMPVSASGVETAAQLRSRLAALADAEKVPTGSLSNPVQYGLLALQSRFGIPAGYSPEALVAADLLAGADRLLARDDVGGALAVLERLPAPQAEALAPWLEAARRHQMARSSFEALAAKSRERIQQRARSAGGG